MHKNNITSNIWFYITIVLAEFIAFFAFSKSVFAYQSLPSRYILSSNFHSLFISIIISSSIAFFFSIIFRKIKKMPLKYTFYLIIANITSMLLIYFLFPKINAPNSVVDLFYLLVTLVVIVFLESYIIHFLSKKEISMNNLFLFVGVFNAVNLIIGSAIFILG